MRARNDRGNRGDWGAGTRYDQSPTIIARASMSKAAGAAMCCRTIFGAAAGGLVGSAVSHGNGGAVIGGAVLGGLLGNTVVKDIDCDDQPYAFNTYSDGLNGDVGPAMIGIITSHAAIFSRPVIIRDPVLNARLYRDHYRGNRELTRTGTACRASDGHWRFD